MLSIIKNPIFSKRLSTIEVMVLKNKTMDWNGINRCNRYYGWIRSRQPVFVLFEVFKDKYVWMEVIKVIGGLVYYINKKALLSIKADYYSMFISDIWYEPIY